MKLSPIFPTTLKQWTQSTFNLAWNNISTWKSFLSSSEGKSELFLSTSITSGKVQWMSFGWKLRLLERKVGQGGQRNMSLRREPLQVGGTAMCLEWSVQGETWMSNFVSGFLIWGQGQWCVARTLWHEVSEKTPGASLKHPCLNPHPISDWRGRC